jgi:SSS family solute:Na+ symporter
VTVGKITTVVATVLAIVLSPVFGHYGTIIEGLNKLISYIAPPITAVFLFGVFWKKASGKAAYITLVAGAVAGLVMFFLDWNGWYAGNFMMTAFYLLALCSVLMIASSFAFPETLREESKGLVWESWREPLAAVAGAKGLGDYRVLSGIVVVVFVLLYIAFR